MNVDKGKKVLFVVDMEYKSEHLMKQVSGINPENIIILHRDESEISQPFGDIMRDVIIAVYQEEIEEIFVVAAKDEQKFSDDILNKVEKNKDFQKKIQTLDYLFKHCIPEFPDVNICEWLKGGKITANHVQKSINTIRNHPLMPSDVKIRGIFIDMETEEMLKMGEISIPNK